jgi:hypothetical protein
MNFTAPPGEPKTGEPNVSEKHTWKITCWNPCYISVRRLFGFTGYISYSGYEFARGWVCICGEIRFAAKVFTVRVTGGMLWN